MIRYTLRCADGHRFDSWFQSADAYDGLAARGLVGCAVCGDTDVRKAMMAPPVATAAQPGAPQPDVPSPGAQAPSGRSSSGPGAGRLSGPLSGPAERPPHPAEEMLRAMRAHIEKHSTYVGGSFAREARAMHLGDIPEKPIHGEARPEEARALIEEGVPILPLPIPVGGKRH